MCFSAGICIKQTLDKNISLNFNFLIFQVFTDAHTDTITCFVFLGLEFLSPCLSSMMLYVWARRNPTVLMNFLEIIQVRAPFMPWVVLMFLLLLGFSPKFDLIGIVVGHLYFYIEDVVPKIPETEDVK
ncbi:MAG: hypothetical protein ACK56I_17915, partial [bacterium]